MTGQVHAYFVRSPHAFADIKAIDTTAAKAVPGVLAVLTAADMEDAKLGNISQHPPVAGRGGTKLILPFRPALAGKTVRHIGEAVAVVIGETLTAAQDGAELVTVEYEERTPAVDLREAVKQGAPQVWPEAPGNIAVDWVGLAPDPDANAKEVESLIAAAKHVAKVSVLHQRIVVASMEPRGATASYDPAEESYLLRCCSQSARALRDGLAPIVGVANPKLRVITEDVGGAFGLKTGPYPEYLAIMVAAKKLGRPVHWMSNRAESFLSDNHARDAYSDVELALDERGKFLALRIRHLGNMGAYIGAVGANIQTVNLTRCLPGMYDIKQIDIDDEVRVHQHDHHRALSRRRTAGGELHSRARDRRGRARHRHRPGEAATPQPDQAQVDAVQDRGRHHHRQRRVRSDPRQGAGARRLRRLQAAPARGRQARQVSRARHFLHAGACRRISDRRHPDHLPGRRPPAVQPERPVDRAEPRHRVQPDGGRAARHQA